MQCASLILCTYGWGRAESTYNKKSSYTQVMDPESTLLFCSGMDKFGQGLGPQVVDLITMRQNFTEIIDNSSHGKVSI